MQKNITTFFVEHPLRDRKITQQAYASLAKQTVLEEIVVIPNVFSIQYFKTVFQQWQTEQIDKLVFFNVLLVALINQAIDYCNKNNKIGIVWFDDLTLEPEAIEKGLKHLEAGEDVVGIQNMPYRFKTAVGGWFMFKPNKLDLINPFVELHIQNYPAIYISALHHQIEGKNLFFNNMTAELVFKHLDI